MGGVECRLMQLWHHIACQPACRHKLHGMVDLVTQLIVTLSERIVFDEVEVPLVYLVQICQPATRKCTKQVQCRCRLVIGSKHIFRFRHTCLFSELDGVDDVSTVTWQLDAVFLFKVRRTRFGKLPCDTTDFHYRFACRIHQYHIHLKHQFEEVFDILRIEVRKTLRTVTPLKQKGFTATRCGKLLFESARLSCKD